PAPALDETACACATARRAAHALTRMYDVSLRDTELEVPQFALLNMLDKVGPCSQVAMGRRFAVGKTTLSPTRKPLARKGLGRAAGRRGCGPGRGRRGGRWGPAPERGAAGVAQGAAGPARVADRRSMAGDVGRISRAHRGGARRPRRLRRTARQAAHPAAPG